MRNLSRIKAYSILIKKKNDTGFELPDDDVKKTIFRWYALNWSMKSLTSAYSVTSTKINRR